ncbi:Chitin synthase, partial [Geodia barretti]
KEIILEVFPVDNRLVLLQPPTCTNKSADCLTQEVAVNMSSPFKVFQLPTSPTTWYVAVFAVTYTAAALLHLWEFPFLFHCIWYILGLPSGYLLLLIYSAVNLDSQSWGTREAAKAAGGGGGGFKMVKKWAREGGKVVREFLLLCCGKRGTDGGKEVKVPLLQEDTESDLAEDESGGEEADGVEHKQMSSDAKKWLKRQECQEYIDKFQQHGYCSLSYIASMTRREFKAIGIDKLGFVLRLEKAAKKLPAMVIETDVPPTVTDWLTTLEMEEYTEVFHRAGYKTEEDIENLKEIDDKELKRMGIVKMGMKHWLHSVAMILLSISLVISSCSEAQQSSGVPVSSHIR